MVGSYDNEVVCPDSKNLIALSLSAAVRHWLNIDLEATMQVCVGMSDYIGTIVKGSIVTRNCPS